MSDVPIRFAKGEGDLSSDPRIACLAASIVSQQAAGFGSYVDARETKCPDCGASGFNTGWGVWQFSCGGAIHTDGEPADPCGTPPMTPQERIAEKETRG